MEKFEELVIENPEAIKGGQSNIVIDDITFLNGIVISDEVVF